MERIAGGFSLAEAPTVADGVLLVSDVLGGGVRRFDAGGNELEPLLDRRRGIGGIGVLPDGSVVVSGGDLSLVGTDGSLTTFAPLVDGGTGYNDLTVTPDGSVLAGMLTSNPMAGEPTTRAMLVRVDAGGAVTSTPVPFGWPNGIGLAPGGGTLYFVDYAGGVLHRTPWEDDLDTLALEPWITSPTGDFDGLAVDDDGSLWLAGGAGGNILHHDADGTLVEDLDVPDRFVSSCCLWPGDRRLVITTDTGVFVHDLA